MDKNKIIQNAQKFVQKGQIDKAIKEYSKIVEADPKDVRTWLKIGDLYAKKGSGPEAAATYMKVAETYSQQGFFLKSVAVYKQILKLQPDLVDVNLKLADLYHQLGLLSDAMAQFQAVVGFFESSGNSRAVFETLRKMLDIDPDNVASRIKLAEMYSKEGMVAEAVQEFRNAAAWLKERNRIDDYVKVIERLIFHQPEDLALTRDLANIYLAKGDTKRSLAKLQICFKADPRDVETLHLLGQAFLELGQVSKTVSVFKELAKIHGDAGRIDDQRAAWRKVLEIAPEDREAQAALGGRPAAAAAAAPAGPPPGAAPAAGRPPGAAPGAGPPPGARPPAGPPPGAARPPAGPPPGVRAPQPAPAAQPAAAVSPAAAVAKLLTETDVYVKYGLHDKALEHLKKVFAIVPTHLEGHEKAKDLFQAAGNTEAAGHELVTLIQLTMASEPDRARGYLKELAGVAPHLPEYQGFVAKLGTPEVEQVSFLDEPGNLELADEDDEFVIADDDDEVLVADDSDGFTDELGPEDDVFGVDIAHDEDDMFLVEDHADDIELVAAGDHEPDEHDFDDQGDDDGDAFVIDDDLLTGADLDQAMAEAASAVGDESEPAVAALPDDFDDEDLLGEDDDLAIIGSDDSFEEDMSLVTDHGIIVEDEIEEPAAAEGSTEMLPAESIPGLSAVEEEDFGADDTLHGIPDLDIPAAGTPKLDGPDLDGADSDSPELVTADLDADFDESSFDSDFDDDEPEVTMLGKPAPETAEAFSDDTEEEEPSEGLSEEMADELEEAQFFLEQGLPDEAREVVQGILDSYPDHAGAKELLERIEAEAGGDDMDASDVEVGDLDEAEAPGARDFGDVDDGGDDGFDAFDLAGELADELAEIESADDGEAPLQDFQISADDVFAEFKKGVAKAVGSEDAETHYDLGIAYREMGLTADAIGEFELAAKQPKKLVDSLTMVGMCHRELGNLDAAIVAYKTALAFEGIHPDAAKAVHYDLGSVYQDLGDAAKAALNYRKTLRIDPKFRDAKERLAALGDVPDDEIDEPAQAGGRNGVSGAGGASGEAAPEKPRSSKTGKVGYV